MGLVRNIAKNTLAMGSVQVAGQISTFLLSLVLSSYLGATNYGTYVYAFGLASTIFIIADFGLGFQMVVEVAPDKSKAAQHLTNTLFLRIVLGGIAFLVTVLVVLLQNPPLIVTEAIIVIAAATSMNWLAMVFTSVFTTYEKMHYVLLTTLVERTFTVTAAIALVMSGFGLGIVVIVVLFGSVINLVTSFLVASRFVVKPERKPEYDGVKRQFRRAVPYAIQGALFTSMYSINIVLVKTIMSFNGGDASIAFQAAATYAIAFNMVLALIAVPGIMISSLMPVIARLYRASADLTRLTQQKVMKYMFAVGVPITVGGFILADKIVLLFYKPEYIGAVPIFQILILVVAISYFSTGIGSVLASANLIRLNTLASGIGAGMNILFCFLLIPFFDAEGAALAFTIALLAISISDVYLLSRYVFKVNLIDILIKPLLAAAGMGLVLILIPGVNLFLSLLIGAAVYFILLLAMRALDNEDKEILVRMLNKGA